MAKVDLFPDFKEFLKSLNSARVKYLVLGGYAVIHYGYRRVTDDFDVWVAVDSANAERLSRVLQKFAGFTADAVKPAMFLEVGKVFMFGREPGRIDILTGPSGVQFDDCYARRNVVDWDGVKVPLISINDLKKNKRASGRAKDQADLDNLPTTADHRATRASRPRKKRGA